MPRSILPVFGKALTIGIMTAGLLTLQVFAQNSGTDPFCAAANPENFWPNYGEVGDIFVPPCEDGEDSVFAWKIVDKSPNPWNRTVYCLEWYWAGLIPCNEAPIWRTYYNKLERIDLQFQQCVAQGEGRHADAMITADANRRLCLLAVVGIPAGFYTIDLISDWARGILEGTIPVVPVDPCEPYHNPGEAHTPTCPREADYHTLGVGGPLIKPLLTALTGAVLCHIAYARDKASADNTLANDQWICESNRRKAGNDAERERDKDIAAILPEGR
ncbi:MAG: hypothetical protein M2R45_04426 [Verrucomicrobia subdivision 3 bacterium]|nr:hypothetical protein [Limisphaerales bacterium]MCS1413514.1 hypothetical protein [Limisphaerales bacterium]